MVSRYGLLHVAAEDSVKQITTNLQLAIVHVLSVHGVDLFDSLLNEFLLLFFACELKCGFHDTRLLLVFAFSLVVVLFFGFLDGLWLNRALCGGGFASRPFLLMFRFHFWGHFSSPFHKKSAVMSRKCLWTACLGVSLLPIFPESKQWDCQIRTIAINFFWGGRFFMKALVYGQFGRCGGFRGTKTHERVS